MTTETDTYAPAPGPDDVPMPGMPEPAPAGGEDRDPDAPWGRRADGTPRAKPGPGPGRAGGAAGRNRRPGGAPPPRTKPAAGAGAKRSAPDYRTGVLGLMQLPATALAMAALQAPEPLRVPLTADAAAITMAAPGVADALAALAHDNAQVAAVLERILTVGPYGALIAALLPLVAQIVVNHGKLPPGLLGTMPPEELAAHMQAAGA